MVDLIDSNHNMVRVRVRVTFDFLVKSINSLSCDSRAKTGVRVRVRVRVRVTFDFFVRSISSLSWDSRAKTRLGITLDSCRIARGAFERFLDLLSNRYIFALSDSCM